MFQDGEDVRNVPDPTNIKYIPGEVSGHVCRAGISPHSVGQVYTHLLTGLGRVCLRFLVMARSKKGTKLCKSNTARKALTVGDKSDAGSSHGFGLMLNIASGV